MQPSGCPRAIAPPYTLIFNGLIPNVLITASDCEANASLSSIKSILLSFKFACFSAFGTASTGPIPIILGGTPATE